ncbi:MAG: plasmid pRiA4b ORF-3 family protein, partial [Desulfofustis sp.]|nr:plasmid pRiA4b ORF-3 family protein [Desulfofustis sp.]
MARVLRGDFSKRKGADERAAAGNEPVPDYRLQLSICFSDPLIWRRLLVPGTLTLADLHRIIQISLGWGDVDSHRFLVGKIFYQPGACAVGEGGAGGYDEAAFTLHQLEAGMQFIFTYLYDGGQGWEIELVLEDV